jgi:hypothetical protein
MTMRGYLVLMAAICVAVFIFILSMRPAPAQGIYMGRDGRAHAQVIVGADGSAWPVAPTFCTPGFGPCPVVLGVPGVPPAAPLPPAPPAPLGWLYAPYTQCADPPRCSMGTVTVQADGLNVRITPDGPPVMALVNGTPFVPLDRRGNWFLVAPACSLTPTFLWSWTAGVPLNRCWIW